MNQEESRCPRCSDYDKVKEELESNKRTSDKEVKDSLKNCESQKKKLQKQLLTAGAIAIIAGTILGKDFVDKVAEYIDSFNDVKNKATGLVGMATTPVISTQEQSSPEKPEEEKPEDTPVYKPTGIPTMSLARTSVFDDMFLNTSLVDTNTLFASNDMNPLEMNIFYPTYPEPISMDISDLLMGMPIEGMILNDFVFDSPSIQTYPTPLTIVPGAGTLSMLGVGLLTPRSRRR